MNFKHGLSKTKEYRAKYIRNGARLRRLRVLFHYGNKCICCGETEKEFLALDHINGGGNKHRKSVLPKVSGGAFYHWIEKENYPNLFQVMCHNCNYSKHFVKGICKHRRLYSHFDDVFVGNPRKYKNNGILCV